MLMRQIKSELLKGKHSMFFALHLIIPVVAILIVWLYYGRGVMTNVNTTINMYMTLLAVGFPVGIAWMTEISVGWEETNGFQRMIMLPNRGLSLIAKLIVLYCLGTLTTIVAVIGGLLVLTGKCELSLALSLILMLMSVNLMLYPLHLFVNIRIGKAISLLLGFAGSVGGMVLITTLGDKIWQWIPYSISARLVGYYMLIHFNEVPEMNGFYKEQLMSAIPFMIVWCIALLTILILWFRYWEGKKASE